MGRLTLGGHEVRSGFTVVPEEDYTLRVDRVNKEVTRKGDDMYAVGSIIEDPVEVVDADGEVVRTAGCFVWDRFVFKTDDKGQVDPDKLWNCAAFIEACGVDEGDIKEILEGGYLVGQNFRARVVQTVIEEGERKGELRNEVARYLKK